MIQISWKSFTINVLGILFLKESLCAPDSVETALRTFLFTNYSTSSRPIAVGQNYHKQIKVTAQFGLSQIESLNEKDQYLSSSGFFVLLWTDELLTWTPADYGGAEFIIVPANEVWLPEITPINSVIGATEIASLRKVTRVRIMNTGDVLWIPGMKWQTSCTVDVTNFPYDTQGCELHFANWMYTADLLNFTAIRTVSKEAFQDSQEWTLLDSFSWAEELRSLETGMLVPVLKLKLKLKRSPTFYEWNLIVPITLLSFLIIPIFILPVESGEKVSLGVTLMLAYSIFLLMMTDVTPRSGTTPRLTISILVCIIISGIGILISVLIVNIHHHNPHKPVPALIKRLVLIKLAKLLCCMNYTDENEVEPITIENINKANDKYDINIGKDFTSSAGIMEILKQIEYFKSEKIAADVIECNKRDWNNLARVIDRLIVIVYSIYFVINIGVLMSFKFAD